MGLCVESTAASFEYKDGACKDHINELTSEEATVIWVWLQPVGISCSQ